MSLSVAAKPLRRLQSYAENLKLDYLNAELQDFAPGILKIHRIKRARLEYFWRFTLPRRGSAFHKIGLTLTPLSNQIEARGQPPSRLQGLGVPSLKQSLTIRNLPSLCVSISTAVPRTESEGDLYCFWGAFSVRRDEIRNQTKSKQRGAGSNILNKWA